MATVVTVNVTSNQPVDFSTLAVGDYFVHTGDQKAYVKINATESWGFQSVQVVTTAPNAKVLEAEKATLNLET